MQIMMVFGPSMSKDSGVTSLLRLDRMGLGLTSALGSTFAAGLATTDFASTGFGAILGSRLGAGFGAGAGAGAGLGCRFGSGFVSALLGGLLGSLDSTLFSNTGVTLSFVGGALSLFTSEALDSGVTDL